jgi:hypothetical protein
MVGGTPHACSNHTGEAKYVKIELVDKSVNNADRIVRCDIVVEGRWKLDDGVATDALDVWHEQAF